MNYKEAVAAAAGALRRGEDASWELARLTWEHTFSGRGDTDGQRDLGRAPLGVWCADLRRASGARFSETTGKRYRLIWDRFRSSSPDDRPSWGEAYVLIEPSASGEATLARHADQHLLQATPERKRELFERLSADPEVVAPSVSLVRLSRDETASEVPASGSVSPDPVAIAKGALRLAAFVLDARVAAQHYAQALGETDLDAAGREAEVAAVDTVLRAWERLRLIINVPGGIRLVEQVEDFLADARA